MDMPYLDDIEFDDLFNSNGAVPGLDSALDDLFSSESSLMCSSFPELELNENYFDPNLISDTQIAEMSIDKPNLQELETEPSRQEVVPNYKMPDKKNHHHHKQPAQAHCWTKADEDEDKIEELGTNEKPVFKCPYCFDSIEDFCLFVLHLKKHEIDKNIYKCELCVDSFDNKKDLQSHKACCHPEYLGMFICELCFTNFKRRMDLIKHIKKNHAKEHLTCTLCEKPCPDAYTMMHHYMGHAQGFLFVCEICNYGTNVSKDYNAHVSKSHLVKKYKCDVCEKCFGVNYQLKRHMKTHRKPTKFECNECPYQCVTKRGYLKHIKLSHKSDAQNSVTVSYGT